MSNMAFYSSTVHMPIFCDLIYNIGLHFKFAVQMVDRILRPRVKRWPQWDQRLNRCRVFSFFLGHFLKNTLKKKHHNYWNCRTNWSHLSQVCDWWLAVHTTSHSALSGNIGVPNHTSHHRVKIQLALVYLVTSGMLSYCILVRNIFMFGK